MNNKDFYLIDTHCHINIIIKKNFDVLLTEEETLAAQKIICDAKNANVKQIINVATSFIESQNCITLAQKYPALFSTIGIHPNDLAENWPQDFNKVKDLLEKKELYKIVAVGEIGIDMYRPGYNLQRQSDGFKKQIELALQYDLPVIVHTRAAPDETLQIIQNYKNDLLRGVIHCFPYDEIFAQDIITFNFKLGIGGTITYPNNKKLQNIVKKISVDHIVLETDAPFLAPQSIRGEQNNPASVRIIAEFIAELRQKELSQIATVTTQNARNLFKLPSPLN